MRKMKNTVIAFGLVSLLGGFASCKKDPGTGGLATIKGKVYAYDYNTYGELVDSGYIADEKVYISYGDHTTVDDDVNTSYTGGYMFEWLQKGDYTVFVLSKCDTCPLGTTHIEQKVTIESRKQVVNLPDFVIKK